MRAVGPKATPAGYARALLAFLLVIGSDLGAATFSVTRSDDPIPDGCQMIDCSLREAVLAANALAGADTIVLQGVTYELSQAGVDDFSLVGDLDITESLTVAGVPDLVPPLTSIDANGIDRVFDVRSGASLTLQTISVTGGGNVGDGGGIRLNGHLVLEATHVHGNSATSGGGIHSSGSTLRIEQNSSIHGNTVTNNAGGILKGPGEFVLKDSRIGNNTITGSGTGAGIYVLNSSLVATNALIDLNSGGSKGGGIYALNSELTLIATTVRDNGSDSGAGLYLQSTGSVAEVINSVFHDNTAASDGGGAYAEGDLNLTNSTFSDNSATSGAGVFLTVAGGMATDHATFSNNIGNGSVVFIEDGLTRASAVTWLNSILSGGCMRNGANVTSLGGNLESAVDTCGLGSGTNDQVSVGVLQLALQPLADNGGPTLTNAIGVNSPARDNAVCTDSCKKTDQRFFTRGADPVDSGAFEFGVLFSDSFESL